MTLKHENTVTSADVLIVGNGALGLFLALEIKTNDSEKRVAVIGPSARETGASQAAGAMLGCFGEVTADTLRTKEGRKRFELGVNAHKLWDDTLDTLKPYAPKNAKLKVSDDTHIILNSIGHTLDSHNFDAIVDALEQYDQTWDEIDANTIPGYNPRPDCRSFRAIHLPNEGAIDARGVLKALEDKLHDVGVTMIDDLVSKVIAMNGKVSGVQRPDGTVIEAEHVVIAAGAKSASIVATLDDEIDIIPTFPGLGLGMMAKRSRGKPFESVVRTPNRGFACGLHVVPSGEGREYLGSTNRIIHDVLNVSWLEDLRYLSMYSMQQLDEEIAHHQIENWLRGCRPITLDGFPLIGWLPVEGLYLMTGTYRDGFHSAPLIAQHAARELAGEQGILDPIFQPTRQPISTRTHDQSIEDYVQNSIATWYETKSDSCEMPTRVLENIYRDKALRVYEKLKLDFAFGPDVLWYAHDHDSGAEKIVRYFGKQHPRAAAAE